GNEFGFIFSAVRGTTTKNLLSTGQTKNYHENDDGAYGNGYPLTEKRFATLDDGTVLDRLSGLVWLQDATCTTPAGASWLNALESVHSNTSDPAFFNNCPGYTKEEKDNDWRIPNINELQTLINFNFSNPAIPDDHPFTLLLDKPFWTSTSSNGQASTHAWAINLNTGSTVPDLDKTELAYAWPVRGPIPIPDMQTNVATLKFDTEFTNASPAEKTLRIENIGNDVLKISNISILNSGATSSSPHFSLGRDGCAGRDIDPDTSCTTTIQFHPRSVGNISADISIESNVPGIETFTQAINGRGIEASSSKSDTRCFIATATYGSYLEPEVVLLRNFRDKYLLGNSAGRWFVTMYYRYSPAIANIIKENEAARSISLFLLTPLIYCIKYPALFIIFSLLFIMTGLKRYNFSSN
ncbi:MAG: CFI-box-CTERM domain-containing protein, partial [Gammaproteobacteria bacterium]|nr:CFI-box-CTERM domain-containing protein [Gammaproteobacteria bacterium]